MNKKDFLKRVRNFIYFLVIASFFVLYFSSEAGYFDNLKTKRVALTAEQIKAFEEDIALGKEIDLNSYYQEDINRYNNKFTRLGTLISSKIEHLVTAILDKTFKCLNDFLNS